MASVQIPANGSDLAVLSRSISFKKGDLVYLIDCPINRREVSYGVRYDRPYTVIAETGDMVRVDGLPDSLLKARFTKTSPYGVGVAFPFEVDKTTVVNTRKVKKTKTIEVEEDEPTYTVTLTKDAAEGVQELLRRFLNNHDRLRNGAGVQHQSSKMANDTLLPVFRSLEKAGVAVSASEVIKSITSVGALY